MPASNDTIREIAKALRRHVDASTLEEVINDLLDVPGNRSFREAIEALAREFELKEPPMKSPPLVYRPEAPEEPGWQPRPVTRREGGRYSRYHARTSTDADAGLRAES
jgi:hypothetical protein